MNRWALELGSSELDAGSDWRLILVVIEAKSRPEETAKRRWTFDEMAAELPESNLPTELWDGGLVRRPAPSFFHQSITAEFYKALDSWVRQHRLGKTAFAPLDMILTGTRVTQPDVVFISNEWLSLTRDGRLCGAADLVAEVISPE